MGRCDVKKIRWIILIVVIFTALYVSLKPGLSLDRGKDKIAHFLFYGVVTFLMFPSFSKWSFVISSSLAAAMDVRAFTTSTRVLQELPFSTR